MNKISKLVLFVNDCNMFEGRDPLCNLVEIPSEITMEMINQSENRQIGATRMGGSWIQALEDINVIYIKHSNGRLSDYQEGQYDELYKVISGNY